MWRNRLGWAAVVVVVCLSLASRAEAHALLLKAIPAKDAVVAGNALVVELRFNSRIDAKRSKITLITPNQAADELTIAPQREPQILTAPAKTPLPGEYKIRWQVLAVDGHITRGEIPFRVK